MRACYISGPMRGYPELNFPAFFAAETRLRVAGWDRIFNPARMDIDIPWNGPTGTPACLRFFASRDLDVLTKTLHAEEDHAIVLLPGWEQSKSALAEVAVARWVGLRVLTIDEACRP